MGDNMKYGLGETIADYGFPFLEKLHSPIFLLHVNGSIKKINEAGRKLILVGHVTSEQIREISRLILGASFRSNAVDCQRYRTCSKSFKLISKRLGTSDYLLVELIR